MSKILSLHLPKTAGVSFLQSLRDHFGNKLLCDYDMTLSSSPYDRRRKAIIASLSIAEHGIGQFQCIHGHFLPSKYMLLASREDISLVTWMRNPVERLISHYFYWKLQFNPHSAIPLHHQMINEEWTLEDFCFHPRLRNTYTQYLWGVPLEHLAFVGITEHYSNDLKYFSERFLRANLQEYDLNRSSLTSPPPKIDKKMRIDIEQFHDRDMHLYHRALAIRDSRQ